MDHYFVRAKDLEATRAFYCDVVGFEVRSPQEIAICNR